MADFIDDSELEETFSKFEGSIADEDSDEDENLNEDENTSENNDSENTSDEEGKKDDNEDGKEGDKEESKPKKKNRLSRRFHKLTEQRRNDRETIARYEKQFGKIDEEGLPAKPDPKRYHTEQDYNYACGQWTANAKNIIQGNDLKKQEKLAVQQKSFQQKLAEEKGNFKDAEKLIEDFVEDMGNEPLTQEVNDAFCNSSNGVDLFMYFTQNRDVLAEISEMSPGKAAMTLGKISEKLSSISKRKKKKKAVSGAPKPNTRLKSNSKITKAVNKMTMDEYVAHRRKKKK